MRFLRSSSVSLRNLPSGPGHDGGVGAAVSSSAFDSSILQTSASSSVRHAVPLFHPLTRIVPNLGVPLVASVFNQPFGKHDGKQGHASLSATPGPRAASQMMILTRHPATVRSQPPRAGGLLCMSLTLVLKVSPLRRRASPIIRPRTHRYDRNSSSGRLRLTHGMTAPVLSASSAGQRRRTASKYRHPCRPL
jgi:hypothetical protein